MSFLSSPVINRIGPLIFCSDAASLPRAPARPAPLYQMPRPLTRESSVASCTARPPPHEWPITTIQLRSSLLLNLLDGSPFCLIAQSTASFKSGYGHALRRRALHVRRIRLRRRPRVGGALGAGHGIRLRPDFLFNGGQRSAGDRRDSRARRSRSGTADTDCRHRGTSRCPR